MVLDASGRRALPVGGRSQHVPTNAPSIWDRYHARQDAYRETNRITQDCSRGLDYYCDELALRQAKRPCSAFGPLGEDDRDPRNAPAHPLRTRARP